MMTNVGFFRDWFWPTAPPVLQPLSWMSPQDSVQTIFIPDDLAEALGAAKGVVLDMPAAMRIPAFKRAHDVHCGVLARLPWVQYDDQTRLTPQPDWLVTSKTGVPPRTLRWGVASDSFAYGAAVVGFELDAAGEFPVDALHIPKTMWSVGTDGQLRIDPRIPPKYRQRVVWMPLGNNSNGMLIDAIDTIADAKGIAEAYRDRIKNPIAQTVLSVAADRWDGWDRDEREEFRQLWMTGRSTEGGSTAMKPDWVTVDLSGQIPADLFESGRNANRLDMANHAGLPASIVEGAKQGGGSGDMHYSTEAGGSVRNELWDYGLGKYADAWAARLSLDDVCPSGQSIRVDASNFLTSTPTEPQTSED
jgi:hypothetical protein